MALRQAQAENDLEIRLNEAKHARSLIRLKASESLKQRNALSLDQWNLERLEETISGSEVENAKLRRRLAQLQLEQTKAAVRAREIVSPHAGVVVAVFKKAGEAVTPGTPIFQIVDPDHILVSGNLDVNDAFRVRPGQSVRVAPVVGGIDLAVEHNIFLGRIKFVDSVIDARTQTCKVVAEVDNREGMLRAGLMARMEILLDETLEARRDLGASGPTGSRPTVVPAPPSAEKSPNSVGGDPDHRGAGTDSRPAVVFPRSQARP
jgi:multidrug efflux pump subunit AcrA (membrane-fusion protein)